MVTYRKLYKYKSFIKYMINKINISDKLHKEITDNVKTEDTLSELSGFVEEFQEIRDLKNIFFNSLQKKSVLNSAGISTESAEDSYKRFSDTVESYKIIQNRSEGDFYDLKGRKN